MDFPAPIPVSPKALQFFLRGVSSLIVKSTPDYNHNGVYKKDRDSRTIVTISMDNIQAFLHFLKASRRFLNHILSIYVFQKNNSPLNGKGSLSG